VADELTGGGRHARFATAAGFRCVLPDVQRRLDLRAIDAGVHERMLADAWAHAEGYSLVQWTGTTPEGLVDDTSVLESRMSTDPPLDDLKWEPEPADPERLRQRDAMLVGRGQVRYVTAARHDASGLLVGFTSLVRNATDPVGGHQWETIVLPEHRGHRLGVLLKLENLRYVRQHEPDMRTVDTWNAASNTHMVAVNEAVGFRPVRLWGEWEKRLD
jgi:GNAT superfamily N-acetyltransferase